MKKTNYLAGIVGIMMILFVLATITLSLFTKMKNSNADLAKNNRDAANIRKGLTIQQEINARMQKSFEPTAKFLETWSPHFKDVQDVGGVMATIDRIGNSKNIEISNRNTWSRGTSSASGAPYPWRGTTVNVQPISMTGAANDSKRLLTWLGEVERSFPIARFESVKILRKGTSLTLDLKLVFPLFVYVKATETKPTATPSVSKSTPNF